MKRIDHGVQCLLDKKLVEKLRDSQTPLTVCPLSNIKLKVFKKLKDHNLKKMMDEKLMVMVNSDDPAYFGGYINKNLIEIQTALNLSIDDIKTLISNSVSKQNLLEARFKNYLENILNTKETKLNSLNQLLEASSFNRVLDRGFSLVMNNEGKPIKLSSEAPKNANVKIKFSDEIRSAQLDK